MGSRRSGKFQERFDVWPGFTDIMVGVFLVFAFVVTLFTITETVLSHSLSKKDKELHRLQNELKTTSSALEQLKIEVARLQKLFAAESEKSTGLANELAEQRDSTASALREAEEKTRLLGEGEKQVSELTQKLAQAEESLTHTRAELSEKSSLVSDFGAAIIGLNGKIAFLNKRIAGYLDEVSKLNSMLAESKERESDEKTKTASLQKEIASLTSQLDEITKKLADAKEDKAKQFRLAQLVNLVGEKDKEIVRLRQLARYRSEFLAKLEKVFAGVSDIKVQGDRFVFQSEILFASGRADINERGKKELDKFITIYKEMAPKLPRDLPLIILVQGHTDIDPVKSIRFKSNWELSAARSLEVVRYMTEKGIPPTRLGAAALSEFHPVAQGVSPSAKRLNRRIEIKITTL
jgi:chemotaxis protein MotB